MDNLEAIEVIKSNWPDGRYTMLREALTMAIQAIEKQIPVLVIKERAVSAECPKCKSIAKGDYCINCGQRLKY